MTRLFAANRRFLIWGLCSLLIVIAIGWWWRGHAQAAQMPQGRRGRIAMGVGAATVGTAVAAQQSIPIFLEALGTVTPLATAVVRPQVAGVLTQVLYKEGELVHRGQVLAQIDPAAFQLALNQSLGNLQRDRAQLQVAQVTLTRDQTLLAEESIAQQDVDTQSATVKQLQGVVATDEAAVASARLNLNYCRIVAPFDGRIGLRPVDVGNYVTPGDAAGIATLTQLAPIDVVFALPSDAITRVQTQAKQAALPTTALDRSRTQVLEEGQFLTLDNQVDVQTGTVRAKARFNNAQQSLFPNQFVNVRLLIDTLHDAVVVPSAAVRHGPQGDFIYLVTTAQTARVQNVTTGAAAGDQISISSGLKAGARVVTEGGDRLTDGAQIKLADGRAGRSNLAGGAEPREQHAATPDRPRHHRKDDPPGRADHDAT